MNDNVGGSVVPKEIIVGLLTVVFTLVYVQWNRRAASIDAIAYAAKIRQQQQQQEEEEEVKKVASKGSLESADVGNRKLLDDAPETNITCIGKIANSNPPSETEIKEGIRNTQDNSGTEIRKLDNGDHPEINGAAVEDTAESIVTKEDEKDDGEIKASADDEDLGSVTDNTTSTNNQWRCACEGGFLPAGMLQSLGGAQAVFNMGIGSCYHTKGEMK